jgi:hypothetical protein
MYVTYTCATKMQVISSVAYSDSQSVSVSASCQCAIGLFDVTVTPEKAHSQVLVSQKNSSSSGAALDPPVWIIPNKALSLSLSLSFFLSLSLSLPLSFSLSLSLSLSRSLSFLLHVVLGKGVPGPVTAFPTRSLFCAGAALDPPLWMISKKTPSLSGSLSLSHTHTHTHTHTYTYTYTHTQALRSQLVRWRAGRL